MKENNQTDNLVALFVLYYTLVKSLYLLASNISNFLLSPSYYLNFWQIPLNPSYFLYYWQIPLSIIIGICAGLALRYKSLTGYWLTIIATLITLYSSLQYSLVTSTGYAFISSGYLNLLPLISSCAIIVFDLITLFFLIFRRHYFLPDQPVNQPDVMQKF